MALRDHFVYEKPKSYVDLTDEQLLDLYYYSRDAFYNSRLRDHLEKAIPKPYIVYSLSAIGNVKREILRRMSKGE